MKIIRETMVPRMRARGEPSFWLSLVLTGVDSEVDEEVEEAEVRVEVRVVEVEEEESVVVELPLAVLVMVLELALEVAVEADEVMVSDDRVVEIDALELAEELEAAVVAAGLPWKVN